MHANPIRSLVRQGEGPQIEFKKTITHLNKFARTLTAFANNRGGTILVGVEDNRHIAGVSYPEEETYMVLQAARDYCYPPVAVHLSEEFCEEGHTVLVVQVPESIQKPHQARDKNNEWHTYVRTDDRCMQADRAMERLIEREPTAEERAEEETPNFSRMEQAALLALRRVRRLSVKDFAKLVNVSRHRAGKLLFNLTREGVLLEVKEGGQAVYVLREKAA